MRRRAPRSGRSEIHWPAAIGAGVSAAAVVILIAALTMGGGPPKPRPAAASDSSSGARPGVAPSGASGSPTPPVTVAPPGSRSATVSGTSCSTGAGPFATEPVELRIPAIGVSTPVVALGLNADRTLQVPPLTYTGTHEVGWYKLGPTPGTDGAAVIVGHVDSTSGPAVFYRLGALTAGNTVQVIAANCQTSSFVITSVAQYPKDKFPTQQVYGATPDAELRLITCGGTFDPATGHYLSNIVAYAKTISVA